ncbi:Membrane transporter [Aphelenchoides besseyi]|nr:Membrane transporter [Aphelenchoides besseyi]
MRGTFLLFFCLLSVNGIPIQKNVHLPEEDMTTPEIISYYGYPSETHFATTSDGYILQMHRIPFGIRKEHTKLTTDDRQFWRFSWDEMAQYDLEAMFNTIEEVTGQREIYYLGHSQGTLTMFAKFSTDPEFRQRVKRFFALAPVATVKTIKGMLLYLADYVYPYVGWIFNLLGDGEFLPSNWLMKLISKYVCDGEFEAICANIIFLVAGPETSNLNQTRMGVITSHAPGSNRLATDINNYLIPNLNPNVVQEHVILDDYSHLEGRYVGLLFEMERPVGSFVFFDNYRYFILFLGWICLTTISSNMIALNFTLICMVPSADNSTVADNYTTFNYTNTQKNLLMLFAAIGSLVGSLPFNLLYTRYGTRYVFLVAAVLSATSTFALPFAVRTSFKIFLFVRFIQGISYSADFAAMGMICSRWASLNEYAIFISILTCYSPLSSSISNPIAGAICESKFKWPFVYYSHSIACILIFICWTFFYTDHPRKTQFVSNRELEVINHGKSEAHVKADKYVPYKVRCLELLFDLISLGNIGMFLLMYLPTFLKNVLDYSVEETGFFGMIPTLAPLPMKLIFGVISDKLTSITEITKMRIFNTTAVFIPGILYAIVGFVPSNFFFWFAVTDKPASFTLLTSPKV